MKHPDAINRLNTPLTDGLLPSPAAAGWQIILTGAAMVVRHYSPALYNLLVRLQRYHRRHTFRAKLTWHVWLTSSDPVWLGILVFALAFMWVVLRALYVIGL